MGNKSISPRTCLVQPSDFGKRVDVEWRRDRPLTDLITAEVQHRYACMTKAVIKMQYGSIQKYCDASGESYQRVARVLRGESMMTVNDLGKAIERLHISIAFVGADETGQLALTGAQSATKNSAGAFYTPDRVAEYLVRQLDLTDDDTVLEPSFGDGAFLKACISSGTKVDNLYGCEINRATAALAVDNGLIKKDNVYLGDFFRFGRDFQVDASVGNPPFVRVRALDIESASALKDYCSQDDDVDYCEEASEWLPFLIKATKHVRVDGKAAFVLPYDFTYLRYARVGWSYLAKSFSELRVLRVRERLFDDILQDVLLLVAKGRGGNTDKIQFECFDTVDDLEAENWCINKNVAVADIKAGNRPFQKALIDEDLLAEIEGSGLFCQAKSEAKFHIGYVSGNKDFFHPAPETVKQFNLPESSLINAAVSSRQLKSVGYRTGEKTAPGKLWLPGSQLTPGEEEYIKYGEGLGVDKGYKCRKRNPWWIVPGVTRPDAILSVFGDTPKLLLNDGDWAISNSLLGAFCRQGVSPEAFAETWYSSVTRLSLELQIHSLGGGVLVAVPQEANSVLKLKAGEARKELSGVIEAALSSGASEEAYTAYDRVVEDALGKDFIQRVKGCIDRLVMWRKRAN